MLTGIKFKCPFFLQTPAVDSQSSLLSEKSEAVADTKRAAEDKLSELEKPAVKTPETLPSSPENSESKKKPAGAVSLFGGIDILASKQTKSPLDEDDSDDDGFLSKDSPPPNVKKEEEKKKEEKIKTNTVSLFDDEEEDESDWNDPIFTPSKPTAKNTLKVCMILFSVLQHFSCSQNIKICVSVLCLQPTEERPQAKSTGVFQDEELLFSHTQQKDNDPDVDLFATSGKATVSIKDAIICLYIYLL